MNTTIVGLFQFIKAAEALISLNALKTKYLRDFFDALDQSPMLIDKKTFKAVPVTLSPKQRDKWGTKAGIEGLMNGFRYPENRHNPIVIDGHFLKLIYQDDKVVRVMNSIDELPEGYDKKHVRPMTWCEMFYLHAVDVVPLVRCLNTRYPVTGLGSIYPNYVYIKTTSIGLHLKELDENWQPIDRELLEFPDTKGKLAFHDTQVVHPTALPGLGADKLVSFTYND